VHRSRSLGTSVFSPISGSVLGKSAASRVK